MLVPARDLAGIGLLKKISILEFSFHFKVVVNSYIYIPSEVTWPQLMYWDETNLPT